MPLQIINMNSKKNIKKREAILNSIPIFLSKTYQIVDNPEYQDVVSWSEDGKSFIIKDIATLTSQILPKHFKHNNFASFVRQLNMYGFHKIRSNSDGHIFEHEYFKKDDVELLPQIKRRTTSGPTGNHQDASQSQIVALTDSNRQLQIQKQLNGLAEKHQELHNIVSILIEQNKQIIMQNKQFVMKMNKMDEKYRKKLQTLIWMVMFGRQGGQKNFVIPPQANNMLKALRNGDQSFEQSPHNALQAYSSENQKKSKKGRKMIKNQAEINQSPNLDLDQQYSIDRLLGRVKVDHDNQNPPISMKRNKSEEQEAKPIIDDEGLFSPLNIPIPGSPLPSQGQKHEWSQYLENINQQDHFDL